MANLIRSLGYSLGKVHSGLIAYMCDLYRDGTREPLVSFFGALDVQVPLNPVPRREWNSVDLAILDGDNGEPRILVEMKVDDRETGDSDDNYQTVRYANRWPSCDAYLFVTLGIGEYYHPPRSNRFTWLRIRDFLQALETAKAHDDIVKQWAEEVRRKVTLQDAVFRGDRSRLRDYRAGTWNIYFLGQLAAELAPALQTESIDIEPTCYPWGSRPDTILNFGWARSPQYMEINYNGRLNLKISLDGSQTERHNAVDRAIRECQVIQFGIAPTYHPSGRIGDSKTIASFDVGLASADDALRYVHSREETRRRLFELLRVFYGGPSSVATSNPLIQPTGSAGG